MFLQSMNETLLIINLIFSPQDMMTQTLITLKKFKLKNYYYTPWEIFIPALSGDFSSLNNSKFP